MPLKSRRQARWMRANHPRMAERWSGHTPDIKSLPERVTDNPGDKVKRKKTASQVLDEILGGAIKTAAEQGPPNLGNAVAPSQSCSACKHFQPLDGVTGQCAKYAGTQVQSLQVCDGFEPLMSQQFEQAPVPTAPVTPAGPAMDAALAPMTPTAPMAQDPMKLASIDPRRVVRLARYECPHCLSKNAMNGNPESKTQFRGGAKCYDCGKGFSAIHRKSVGEGPVIDILPEDHPFLKDAFTPSPPPTQPATGTGPHGWNMNFGWQGNSMSTGAKTPPQTPQNTPQNTPQGQTPVSGSNANKVHQSGKQSLQGPVSATVGNWKTTPPTTAKTAAQETLDALFGETEVQNTTGTCGEQDAEKQGNAPRGSGSVKSGGAATISESAAETVLSRHPAPASFLTELRDRGLPPSEVVERVKTAAARDPLFATAMDSFLDDLEKTAAGPMDFLRTFGRPLAKPKPMAIKGTPLTRPTTPGVYVPKAPTPPVTAPIPAPAASPGVNIYPVNMKPPAWLGSRTSAPISMPSPMSTTEFAAPSMLRRPTLPRPLPRPASLRPQPLGAPEGAAPGVAAPKPPRLRPEPMTPLPPVTPNSPAGLPSWHALGREPGPFSGVSNGPFSGGSTGRLRPPPAATSPSGPSLPGPLPKRPAAPSPEIDITSVMGRIPHSPGPFADLDAIANLKRHGINATQKLPVRPPAPSTPVSAAPRAAAPGAAPASPAGHVTLESKGLPPPPREIRQPGWERDWPNAAAAERAAPGAAVPPGGMDPVLAELRGMGPKSTGSAPGAVAPKTPTSGPRQFQPGELDDLLGPKATGTAPGAAAPGAPAAAAGGAAPPRVPPAQTAAPAPGSAPRQPQSPMEPPLTAEERAFMGMSPAQRAMAAKRGVPGPPAPGAPAAAAAPGVTPRPAPAAPPRPPAGPPGATPPPPGGTGVPPPGPGTPPAPGPRAWGQTLKDNRVTRGIGNAGRWMEGVQPFQWGARRAGLDGAIPGMIAKPLDTAFNLVTGKGSLQNMMQLGAKGRGGLLNPKLLAYGIAPTALDAGGALYRGEQLPLGDKLNIPMMAGRGFDLPLSALNTVGLGPGVADPVRNADPLSMALNRTKDLGSIAEGVSSVPFSPIRRMQTRHGVQMIPSALDEAWEGTKHLMPNAKTRNRDIDALIMERGALYEQRLKAPDQSQQIDQRIRDINQQVGQLQNTPYLQARQKAYDETEALVTQTLNDPNVHPWERNRAESLRMNTRRQRPSPHGGLDLSDPGELPVQPQSPAGPAGPALDAALGNKPWTSPNYGAGRSEQLEAEMARRLAVLENPTAYSPQEAQAAKQQLAVLDREYRSIAGQQQAQAGAMGFPALTPNDVAQVLQPMAPEQMQAHQQAMQQTQAQLQALTEKARTGGLSPQEMQMQQQLQQDAQLKAYQMAYAKVAPQLGDPALFAQDLASNNPQAPATGMGLGNLQNELAQQMGGWGNQTAMKAMSIWGGLQDWQKAVLTAGLGLAAFSMMAGAAGGMSGGAALGAAALGLGGAAYGLAGSSNNMFSADHWAGMFGGQEMPGNPSQPVPPPPAGAPVQGPPRPTPAPTPASAGGPSTPAGPGGAPNGVAPNATVAIEQFRRALNSNQTQNIIPEAANYFRANPQQWHEVQKALRKYGPNPMAASYLAPIMGLHPNQVMTFIRAVPQIGQYIGQRGNFS